MKKLSLLLIASLLIGTTAFAQRNYVLQNGPKTRVSDNINEAIAQIENGDTLYLPGGSTALTSQWTIDKELHIIGVGHYPDSTDATLQSFISGYDIHYTNGSNYSSLSGVYSTNSIRIGKDAEDSISNIEISRCNINELELGVYGKCNYINVSECVLRGYVTGTNAQFCTFEKNFFNTRCYYFTDNSYFINNIFFYYYGGYGGYGPFNGCSGLTVENNIFTRQIHNLASSTINNNLFAPNVTVISGSNLGSGNITNNHLDNLFVNSTGVAFSYDEDYHLHPDCDGKSAGTDGTDIGVYGTPTPYKEGAVPSTPHIRMAQIARESHTGTLPIEIKVGAQDR